MQYKVLKYESGQTKEIKDQISIEEPLEIIIKYKDQDKWSFAFQMNSFISRIQKIQNDSKRKRLENLLWFTPIY